MQYPSSRGRATRVGTCLLTDSQRDSWDANGYVVMDDLYSAAELSEIEEYFERYKDTDQPVFDGEQRFAELDKTKRQIRAMHPHRYSAKVLRWALKANVMDVLDELLGLPALLAQTMYYFKPPGSKGQGMHQDNFSLLAKPGTCIAAWTPIDTAEVENGCLYVGKGSHKCDIFCPEGDAGGWMNYGDSHIRPFPREFRPVPLPVRRGQTLFFGGQLIHGSGPNRHATRSRRTFIGHYVDSATERISRYYHPILNRDGQPVSTIGEAIGGGPCGDGYLGAVH